MHQVWTKVAQNKRKHEIYMAFYVWILIRTWLRVDIHVLWLWFCCSLQESASNFVVVNKSEGFYKLLGKKYLWYAKKSDKKQTWIQCRTVYINVLENFHIEKLNTPETIREQRLFKQKYKWNWIKKTFRIWNVVSKF